MSDTKRGDATPRSDRELVISRWVNAPRDLVFRAFTEPAHVAHWWGPFGFRNSIRKMQVEPGGRWSFTMHGPDGTDYPNEIYFEEVLAPTRLRFRHGSGSPNEPEWETEITFETEGTGTRVVLRQTHGSAARAKEVAKYAIEGGNQTMTRMEGYVGTMREHAAPDVLVGVVAEADGDFVFTRTFDAPRELLFRVMTEPAHLEKWFGPPGLGVRVVSSDFRVGGQFRYAMNPGPAEMYGRFVFRECVPPERWAYVVSFTDANFAPRRHPMSATWPLEVLAIQTLSEHNGKTVLWGRSMPIRAPETDRATFRAGRSGMQAGFKGTYDQLEAYLVTLP